jgi:hypothetical protein
MEIAGSIAAWTRPGISIKTTSIAADPGGYGAFAPPQGVPHAGAFIGVYRGKWRTASGEHPYRGTDQYVMEASGWNSPSCGRLEVCATLRRSERGHGRRRCF